MIVRPIDSDDADLVGGYEPAFGKAPADVGKAGLTATWATVLSTFRFGKPDSVRDHALWVACAQAVTEVVAADEAEVYGEASSGLLSRLLGRRIGPPLGALPRMPVQSQQRPETHAWALIRGSPQWHLDRRPISERGDLVGGPDLYPPLLHPLSCFVTPSCHPFGRADSCSVVQGGRYIDAVVILRSARHWC